MAAKNSPSRLSADVSIDLWEADVFRLNQAERQVVPDLRQSLREMDSELAKRLADIRSDSPVGQFQRKDSRELKRLLSEHYKPALAELRLTIVNKVIRDLNRLFQMSISPLARKSSFDLKRHPLSLDHGATHASFEEWIASTDTWIANYSAATKAQAAVKNIPCELVILYCVLHCGLVSVDAVVALFWALTEAHKFILSSDTRFYADLPLAWHGVANQESRRWYCDQRAALLISRLSPNSIDELLPIEGLDVLRSQSTKDQRRTIIDAIYQAILNQLQRENIHPEFLPHSLTDLLSRVEQVMRSEIPALLVDFASRKQDLRSLLRESIGRIYGDPGAWTLSVVQDEEVTPETIDEMENLEGYAPNREDREPEWMEDFRDAFSDTDQDLVIASIQKLLSIHNLRDFLPHFAISFANALLTRGSSLGDHWAISSIKCCALTIARRLILRLNGRDLLSSTSALFEDIYLQILEEVAEDSKEPRRLQRTVAWALREFHRFLVRDFHVPKINETTTLKISVGLFHVNAQVIALDDVFKAIRFIETAPRADWSDRNRQIAVGVTLICFLFGTRRMEALGLESRAYISGILGQLFVRPNKFRDLKTANGERYFLPAVHAYPFGELITKLNESCTRPGTDIEGALFAGSSDDVIVPIIHTALKEVTGQDVYRLHSIRHSFSHFSFLRLMLSELDVVPDLFPHLPLTTLWLRESKVFRNLLYRNSTVSNDHAWSVSMACGHSSPLMFTSYVHCADILLHFFLEQSCVFGCTKQEQLFAASGLPSGPATRLFEKYRLNTDSGSLAPAATHPGVGFAMDLFKERMGQTAAHSARKKHSAAEIEVAPQLGWDLLSMVHSRNVSLAETAATLGIDLERAERILANADEVAMLRTPDDSTWLHGMRVVERVGGANRRRISCPPPLRGIASLHLSEYWSRLMHYRELHPAAYARAIGYSARSVLTGTLSVAFPGPVRVVQVRDHLALLSALCFEPDRIQCWAAPPPPTGPKLNRVWWKDRGISWRYATEDVEHLKTVVGYSVPPEVVVEPRPSPEQAKDWSAHQEAIQFTLLMGFILFQ
jgi:hypothetical protein